MRNFFKKLLPGSHQFQHESGLKKFKFLWDRPNLFRINRSCISKGVAIGFFVSLLPLPFQMLIAASMAFILEANLPIAVLLTWITNPITFVPINFFIYHLGVWILREKDALSTLPSLPEFKWEHIGPSIYAVKSWFVILGKAYFVGLPVVCFGAAFLGYVIVQLLWRFLILQSLFRRKNSRK